MASSYKERMACEQALKTKCRCSCSGALHGARGTRGGTGLIAAAQLKDREAYQSLPANDPHRIPGATERAVLTALRRDHRSHKALLALTFRPEASVRVQYFDPKTRDLKFYPPPGQPAMVCPLCVADLKENRSRWLGLPAGPGTRAGGEAALVIPPAAPKEPVDFVQIAKDLERDLADILRQLRWTQEPAGARWVKGRCAVDLSREQSRVSYNAYEAGQRAAASGSVEIGPFNYEDAPDLLRVSLREALPRLHTSDAETFIRPVEDILAAAKASQSAAALTEERTRAVAVLRRLLSRSTGAGRGAPEELRCVEALRKLLMSAGKIPKDAALTPLIEPVLVQRPSYSMPAIEVDEREYPALPVLRARAVELAAQFGIPLPLVGVAEEGDVNACALMLNGATSILFTRKILDLLTPEELEATLLHEFGHLVEAHGLSALFFARLKGRTVAEYAAAAYPGFKPRYLRADAEARLAEEIERIVVALRRAQEMTADGYAARFADPRAAARHHAAVRLQALRSGRWRDADEDEDGSTHPNDNRRIAAFAKAARGSSHPSAPRQARAA